jgi:hypothetical protein
MFAGKAHHLRNSFIMDATHGMNCNPRASRYWELVSILSGKTGMASKVEDWNWIKAAVLHHFA